MVTEEVDNYKKRTKYLAVFSSVLYVLLFPFTCYGILLSVMAFDNPHMTRSIGLTIMFLAGCIPLSIVFSLWSIWTSYSRGKHRQARLFCLLPLCAFGVFFVLNAFFQILLS